MGQRVEVTRASRYTRSVTKDVVCKGNHKWAQARSNTMPGRASCEGGLGTEQEKNALYPAESV